MAGRTGVPHTAPGHAGVMKHRAHLKAILNGAVKEKLIRANPVADVELGSVQARDWHKIEACKFWKLYGAATASWKPLLALCRLAALRRGDALALRWKTVDFRQVVLKFTTKKTKKKARVPICSEWMDILQVLRHQSLRIDGHVVSREVYVGNIGRDFDVLCKRVEVAPYRDPLHTLRKSCIDDWAKRQPPNVAKEWATHSDIKTTMKFYTRVSPNDELAARGRMFGGGDDGKSAAM